MIRDETLCPTVNNNITDFMVVFFFEDSLKHKFFKQFNNITCYASKNQFRFKLMITFVINLKTQLLSVRNDISSSTMELLQTVEAPKKYINLET